MKRVSAVAGLLFLLGGTAALALDEGGPNVGKDAPEIQTPDWINGDGRTTLADYKGEVVLVEAWKTH